MSDPVLLKVDQSPVQLKVDQSPVQLKVDGGRGAQGIPSNTDAGLDFQDTLKPNEKLGFCVAGTATYTDSFCRGSIDPGTAPASPEVLTVLHNYSSVGTVTIQTNGTVTSSFGTINGVDGDTVELMTGSSPSSLIKNFKYTFSGVH